jgi:hypothetical protein
VCHPPKKIAEFRDVQLTILVSVGHLEFGFNEAQQLSLADFAFIVAAGAFVTVVVHSRQPQKNASAPHEFKGETFPCALPRGSHCPVDRLKMVLKPDRWHGVQLETRCRRIGAACSN